MKLNVNEVTIGNQVLATLTGDIYTIDLWALETIEKGNYQNSHNTQTTVFEPIELKSNLFSDFTSEIIEWKGNGQDHQPPTSKTKQVIFDIGKKIKLVFETWSYRKSEECEWKNEESIMVFVGDSEIFLHKNELHVLQNFYNTITGQKLIIKN